VRAHPLLVRSNTSGEDACRDSCTRLWAQPSIRASSNHGHFPNPLRQPGDRITDDIRIIEQGRRRTARTHAAVAQREKRDIAVAAPPFAREFGLQPRNIVPAGAAPQWARVVRTLAVIVKRQIAD
jgi:hypothetical protein